MIFTQKIYKRPVAEMILDGTKTCTRRLVKEGEFSMTSSGIPECNVIPMTVFKTKGLFESKRIKWQVGRDYCVSLGRGKAGLWYCPKLKEVFSDIVLFGKAVLEKEGLFEWHIKPYIGGNEGFCHKESTVKYISIGNKAPPEIMLHEIAHILTDAGHYTEEFNDCVAGLCKTYLKPFRIKITGIREERLLDCSEENAKKSGFYDRISLAYDFYYSNKIVPKKVILLGHPDSFIDKKKWNPEVWVLDFSVMK